MIIGGLWHGAAWTFVLWGTYQGILLVAHRLARPGSTASTPPSRSTAPAGSSADGGDLPHDLLRLAPLPRPVAHAGQGHAPGDHRPTGDPAASYLLPVAILVLPLLVYQLIQYVSKDSM